MQQNKNSGVYENEEFNISLNYNKDWKLNDKYDNRYEGKDGFFQIGAIDGENFEIDEVVNNEVTHILKSYGSNPQISKIVIQGQEARLIMPSDDQPEGMKNQAELIVKYPKSITNKGYTYSYLVLYADKNNIEKITQTIKFIA